MPIDELLSPPPIVSVSAAAKGPPQLLFTMNKESDADMGHKNTSRRSPASAQISIRYKESCTSYSKNVIKLQVQIHKRKHNRVTNAVTRFYRYRVRVTVSKRNVTKPLLTYQ